MNIEPGTKNDHTQIAALFTEAFKQDAFMYPIDRALNLFVAKDNSEIVGAGAFWENPIHAKVPRISIAVKENRRRHGIGTGLHQSLITSKRLTLGTDGCCFDDDKVAISFLKSLGYNPVLDCYMPVIETSFSFPESDLRSDIQVHSFKAIANTFPRKVLLEFLVNRYSQTHFWNPVTLAHHDPKWDLIAFDETDESLSLVATHNNSLVGVSTAGADETELEIQWAFAMVDKSISEVEILKSLIGEQLKLAHNQGHKTATLECDSTDPGIFQVGQSMTAISSETWRRFRYHPE